MIILFERVNGLNELLANIWVNQFMSEIIIEIQIS